MKQSVFTVSLDFELHWGRFDKANIEANDSYYLQTREAIPGILHVLEKFQMEATWATVGGLFGKDIEEWTEFSPKEKPTYLQQSFSPYDWVKDKTVPEFYLFAPDLIDLILQTPGQELGSHTFSHYYTLAAGQTEVQFRQDLQAAQKIAMDKYGVKLTSLVFPRNQLNQIYLGICWEEGFTAIRSNPVDWYWKDTSQDWLLKKAFRTGDSILPLGNKPSYALSGIMMEESLPIMLPASRFLRPHQPNFPILNHLKINRVKKELTIAAQEGEVYHLWWHPHNHGRNPKESILVLGEILEHFKTLEKRFGMVSKNMRNLVELIQTTNR